MLVQFKYSRKLGDVTYIPGSIHNVPDAYEYDWFFQALVKDGIATIVEPPKPLPPTPQLKKGKKAA